MIVFVSSYDGVDFLYELLAAAAAGRIYTRRHRGRPRCADG